MKAVNLLPPDQRTDRRFGGPKPLFAAGAIALVVSLGLWGYSAKQSASAAESDLAATQATAQQLETRLGAFRAAEQRLARQRLREGAVVALASGRVNWERIVRDMATVLPPQVWLTGLTAEAPAAEAAGAEPPVGVEVIPKGVHVEGYAYRQDQVAQLMARITTVSGLGDPRLASSEQEQLGNRTVVKFVLDIPIDKRAQDRPTLVPAAQGGVTP
ncbi:MAG: PilN domain-containing protein [Miltoncostaeaceae bacterium]